MSENILEMQNVTTCVNEGTSEEKEILKNISLNVKKGDFITFLGTNGAGKSTLLNVINGSLSPRSGSLKIAGNDVTKLSVVKRARFISQVFQDPKAGTAPRMTVAENLLLAKRRGQKRRLKLRGLNNALPEFSELTQKLPNGLSERLNTFTGDLSGEQRQTLSFLMATMGNPEILLLDEHTAALDPKTSQQLMELTQNTIEEKQLTCIMITHHLKDALKYGNRMIILNDGKIVLDKSGKEKDDLTEDEILKFFTN